MATKKNVRKVKNLGTVYYDNTTQQWVGQIENGKYKNGRKKYKRFYTNSQDNTILRMREYKQSHNIISETDNNSLTTQEWFIYYITTIKQNKLKPASYAREIRTYKNNIEPYIGFYKLSDLTTHILQVELINTLIEKGYSYSTIHKAYVLTNECLLYANKQNIISDNPFEFVEEPSKKIFNKKKQIRFFNDNEISRFKSIALSKNSQEKYIYQNGIALVVLIYTGLRAGELMALRWDDINLEKGFISVNKNIATIYKDGQRETIIQNCTKTSQGRIVYFTKSAEKYIIMLFHLRKPKGTDYIVKTKGVRDLSSLSRTYTLICKKANISNCQSLHTLRHTFASLMIRKGIDIKIVSEMLGHSNVNFTYNTYVHLAEEEKAKVMKSLDI